MEGFFVKTKEGSYEGPYDRLNDARSTARRLGSSLEIYHGKLIKKDGKIDASNLSLVPKLKKI